jgi:hypothetical protein
MEVLSFFAVAADERRNAWVIAIPSFPTGASPSSSSRHQKKSSLFQFNLPPYSAPGELFRTSPPKHCDTGYGFPQPALINTRTL